MTNEPFCVIAGKKRINQWKWSKLRRMKEICFYLVSNLPVRFDWSIIGWTILLRALINLKEKANEVRLKIAKTAALISFIIIRQTDVSTCQHYVYNIEEQKNEEMINDSKHHLSPWERRTILMTDVCVCVYQCISKIKHSCMIAKEEEEYFRSVNCF